MKVKIKVPIWNGEKVGVATRYLQDGSQLNVEILYKDLKGNRVYPHKYTMTAEKAKRYPIRPGLGNVPPLYLIPIHDFDIKQKKAKPVVPFVLKVEPVQPKLF